MTYVTSYLKHSATGTLNETQNLHCISLSTLKKHQHNGFFKSRTKEYLFLVFHYFAACPMFLGHARSLQSSILTTNIHEISLERLITIKAQEHR